MLTTPDHRALAAVANALADAAEIHRKASRAAEDPQLAQRLSDHQAQLRELTALVSPDAQHSDGSLLGLIGRVRLAIDSMFGDEDEAAAAAGSEARDKVLVVTDEYLDNPDISPGVKNLLEDVRFRLDGSRGSTVADCSPPA